ncbi:hypothetical protein S83_032754, partial [Arachis hypogaea]
SHKLISSLLFSENHRSHRSPQSCSHPIPPPQHSAATVSLSSPSSPSLCSPVLRSLSSLLQPPFVLLLHRATKSSPFLFSLRTIEATAVPNCTATASRRHSIPQPPRRCHRRARLLSVRRCCILCRCRCSPSTSLP